jgi:hypothetical protein
MSKLKHTHGKWKIRTTIDDSGDYPFPTYDILAIHDYGPEGVSTAYQNPYNARLIAAAPEMLDGIRKVFIEFEKIINSSEASLKDRIYLDGVIAVLYTYLKPSVEKATGMKIEEILNG